MEINQIVKNNSFESNVKIKESFNILLNNKVWIKHNVKQAQQKIGDFFYTVIGKNFDFKVDCYDNDNIVIEMNQISGTNWIDELDNNSFIAYVKINIGVAFCWSVKQLKEFRKTATYKSRKSFTAWSNTTFKNFRLSEMPDCFMLNFDTTPLLGFLKQDKYGDEKYIDIMENKMGIQDFFKSAGDGACLALCYIRAALGKDATPQMMIDALWKAAERNIINVKKDCFVEDAIALMKVANPKKLYSVIKKDVSSIAGIKLGAVRYSYNGYSHWVLVEDGKVIFNSLEDSQCVKYGTVKEARIITILSNI